MAVALDLKGMSTTEKLRLMEDLWQDLSAKEEELASPSWHGEVLTERERLTESGEEKFISWEAAKKQLRDELP